MDGVNAQRKYPMDAERIFDREEAHKTEGIVSLGSLSQTVAGAGAIVLSILGLIGYLPYMLLAVSAIAIGGAFILESGAVALRFRWLPTLSGPSFLTAVGMTTEFLGGIAGVALGVLSLLGLVPTILMPVAAIVFGLTLLFGILVQTQLNRMEMECSTGHQRAYRFSGEAVSAASGIQILFGMGAVALGILSLIGITPLILTLVALLAVGGASLFSGAALSARMWEFSRYCVPQPITT